MAKEFFKDLPNTTTPIKSSRLNGLLDGEEPMGNLVVESIRTKNMFDKNTIVAGDIAGSNTGNRLSSRQVLWLEAGTYTFSCNIASPYRYGILVQNKGIPPLSSATTYIYDAGWKTASNPTTTFTINTAGWVTISFSKEDSSALTPSDVTGFNYQLEKGNTATLHSEYQNLTGINDIYTSEEILIGIWLGKPLYRKVVQFGRLPNATTKSVSTGLTNVVYTNIYGYATDGTYYWALNATRPTAGNAYGIGCYISNNSIIIETGTDKSSNTAYVTIEYTKTTD